MYVLADHVWRWCYWISWHDQRRLGTCNIVIQLWGEYNFCLIWLMFFIPRLSYNVICIFELYLPTLWAFVLAKLRGGNCDIPRKSNIWRGITCSLLVGIWRNGESLFLVCVLSFDQGCYLKALNGICPNW